MIHPTQEKIITVLVSSDKKEKKKTLKKLDEHPNQKIMYSISHT